MSSSENYLNGTVIGTGAAIDVESPGRKATKVEIVNVTKASHGIWNNTMPNASAMKVVTAGTQTYVTTNGITPIDKGFTLGSDADLNATGNVIHFTVWF